MTRSRIEFWAPGSLANAATIMPIGGFIKKIKNMLIIEKLLIEKLITITIVK